MSEESRIQGLTTNICWRIASSYELYPFKTDPLSVGSSPEPVLFGKLSQESYDCHCSILVRVREIDLVTEYDQPFAGLLGSQNHPIDCLIVLAVVLELFHDETRVGGRGEVHEDHLELWKCLQSRHQCHGLS